LSEPDRESLERGLRPARERLGNARGDQAFESGRRVPLEAAVSNALDTTP
jgi:hypothetical protein